MPHINRIRVNNVKYNFGTQFYDDFILRFDGKNALYDLANGGGKSVLMLLLFQNLIPNCTLDEKQPIEKLFRTDQGSTTIHSMIEWRLDSRFIREGYKYMLTGFCARKAREEQRETAAIEYFNYVIFYRGYNDNDLVNLPLSNGKERVTYTGLKSYLKDLGRKDMSLDVHIFERKGEYQRFISQYGLYESHWEILRGINKTEGHVRTYFETRYKTTRKVVEDLLIEEIIQRAFLQGASQETDMADTLVQIKDKLAELAVRKEEMGYYDQQTEILERFQGRVQLLKKAYEEKEELDTGLVKAYRTANDVYRLKEKDLAVHQKEKEYAGKHIYDISRKLDTIRIQEDQAHLKQLEADTEKFTIALAEMKELAQKKQKTLEVAECTNDYVRYLDVRSKWETINALLSQNHEDTEGILSELQHLARVRYTLNEMERQEYHKKLAFTVNAIAETQAMFEEAQAEERRLFSEGAVLQSQIQECKALSEELGKKLKGFYNQLPEIFMETVSEVLTKKKQSRLANDKKIQEIADQQMAIEIEMDRLNRECDEKRQVNRHLEKEKQDILKFLLSYDQEKEKRDKLLQVYGVDNSELLSDRIEQQLRKVILDYELKLEEILKLKKQLEHLAQGSPAVMSDAVASVMEYIRRCHGKNCVFGGDYLKDLSDYDRQILLSRMPFLPEAVIVEGGMAQIKEDHVLLEKDLGDVIVPVIALSQVLKQEGVAENQDVMFLSKNPELYMNPEVRKHTYEQLSRHLEALETALLRLGEREQTIQADRRYMTGFELNYQQLYMKHSERMEVISGELEKNENVIQKHTERCGQYLDEKQNLGGSLEQLDEENQNLDEEIFVLEQMKAVEEQLTDVEMRWRNLERSKVKNVQLQKEAAEKERWTKEAVERLKQEKQEIQEAEDALDRRWKEVYESYYVAGIASDNGLTSEEVDARFNALKDIYETEHLDLEDKRQLMASHQQMMDTLLSSIRKKGLSLRTLDEMSQGRRLLITPPSKLSEMEKEILELRVEIEHQEEILFHYHEDKNKLFGSVAHGVSSVEEKYGIFKEISVVNNDFASFMVQQKQALALAIEKQKQAEDDIQAAYRELRVYDDIRRDLERILRVENISVNRTKESFGLDVDIRKKYGELCEKHQRMRLEIQKHQEAFSKDKEKTVESLRLLMAAELAEAVRTEIGMPENAEDTEELMQQLSETTKIVRMEKERIEKTIQDMVQIKQNFEKQCLQRCMSIKAELERFPAYSRIVLDGKTIPMVMLKIPYVKEEMIGQRMSEYIDAIVARTDAYESQEERLAYIRQQLSWKRLFSVIVTDMNSIRLNLYKRERVKEQSRYLKYEEAVGSTGQSQGIYIQFLIGVVNYISMVYSGGGDGSDLQKVIFIDNPFGAAKDIYIWQPIFELLSTNHVQLIVPTRGATPAITGKFDVNYVLGQKMIDKMQQTVVIDYSSNVDVSTMEFEKLEFEQEVFDFI